jgi:hypothetical protein
LQRHRPPPMLETVLAADKIFAFLRVIYIVPLGPYNKTWSPGDQNFEVPFVVNGQPRDPFFFDLLWPFSMDEKGRLQLTGVLGSGTSSGYDALADFDAMAARLPRRFPEGRE